MQSVAPILGIYVWGSMLPGFSIGLPPQEARHGIQGLADGFIPDIVNLDEIDQVMRIRTQDAIARSHAISHEEGLLVGISSGANIIAATRLAEEFGPGHTIVTVLPDRGERYLSMVD